MVAFRKFFMRMAVVALAFTAAACQTNGWGQNQTWGTLGGAGLGGWAGSNIGGGNGRMAGVAVGTLLGALFGNEIGASMDRSNQMYSGRGGYGGYGNGGYQQYISPECLQFTRNQGALASCEQGVYERRMIQQREAERRAYELGRGYR